MQQRKRTGSGVWYAIFSRIETASRWCDPVRTNNSSNSWPKLTSQPSERSSTFRLGSSDPRSSAKPSPSRCGVSRSTELPLSTWHSHTWRHSMQVNCPPSILPGKMYKDMSLSAISNPHSKGLCILFSRQTTYPFYAKSQ